MGINAKKKWQCLTGLLLIAILLPHAANAQGNYFLVPSITLAEVYDDNVFLTSSQREHDFISRASPAVVGGYRSTQLTLIGYYTFDADYYARHTDFNDINAREEGGIDFTYRPDQLLTLSLNAQYIETEIPSNLNFETGLASGRMNVERFSVTPAARYRFDPRTTGNASYTFTDDTVAGGLDTETHSTSVGLDRRVTRRDTASLAYTYRRFNFENDSEDSHLPTIGWTHRLTQLTSVTLVGGPRFSDGNVDPEILALIRHRLDRGELTFGYARSQSTVLGESGTVETDTFEVTALYSPDRYWQFRAVPSYVISKRGRFDAEVFRTSFEVSYQLTNYLSFIGAYEFSNQDGSLVGPGGGDITRNVIMVGIVLTAPSPPGYDRRMGRSILPNRRLGPDGGFTPYSGEER